MNTLTAVIFLLDILPIKEELKGILNNIQKKKIENLINTFYTKVRKETEINEEEYLNFYKIYRSRRTNEINKKRQEKVREIIEKLILFLETGRVTEKTTNEENDEVINKFNNAYHFITDALKENVKSILEEPLKDKDVEKLKTDSSKNAQIWMAKLYIESKKSKEEFCAKHFITQQRLNKALSYILNSTDENLDDLKNQVLISEMELELEVSLVEEIMKHYNRREKNINLIEFQSLTKLTVSGMLKELRERNSSAYEKLKEFYYEYQNRFSLQPIYFEQVRTTRTIVNGKEMTNEDHDIIEKFIKDNNYPEQRGIYSAVKDAYLKGNIESLRRDALKQQVLEKFNMNEKRLQKSYK